MRRFDIVPVHHPSIMVSMANMGVFIPPANEHFSWMGKFGVFASMVDLRGEYVGRARGAKHLVDLRRKP